MTIDTHALAKLRDLVGGDPEDLAEFIADFSDIAPALVAEMTAGQAAQDWEKVRVAAHTLKSNAKDLGAADLSELSKTVEFRCKEGQTEGLAPLIAQIDTATQQAVAALNQIDPAAV
ncbi:MAG: Hpt domain-containing protein [Pseudomonadota bacterium]